MAFLMTVLGVILVIEGIPWFLSPDGYKKLLLQMLVLSNLQLRLAGLAAMLIGPAGAFRHRIAGRKALTSLCVYG